MKHTCELKTKLISHINHLLRNRITAAPRSFKAFIEVGTFTGRHRESEVVDGRARAFLCSSFRFEFAAENLPGKIPLMASSFSSSVRIARTFTLSTFCFLLFMRIHA